MISKICGILGKVPALTAQRRGIARIACDSLNAVMQSWPQVCDSMQRDGAVILSTDLATPHLTLSKVAELFGSIQGHEKADPSGVIKVTSGPKYLGMQDSIHFDDMFHLHTDGAYLQGLAYNPVLKSMQQILPPKIVGLRAIELPEMGGETVIVDGRDLLQTLLAEDPEIIPPLFSRQGTTLCHGSIICSNTSIFNWDSPNVCHIRYSFDREFYFNPKDEEAFTRLNDHVKRLPQKEIKLDEGEMIFFDNHRLLHGRRTPIGNRCYERIWGSLEPRLLSRPATHIHYDSKQGKEPRTSPFTSYLPLRSTIVPQSTQFTPGIPISDQEAEKLRRLLLGDLHVGGQSMKMIQNIDNYN